MKLRFRDGRTHERTNGDIEALADAMRALKNALHIYLQAETDTKKDKGSNTYAYQM